MDDPKAKIILISAFADEELRDIARSIGAPLLSKPFGADRLVELVEDLLSRQSPHGNF
jgi:hypothetical protein